MAPTNTEIFEALRNALNAGDLDAAIGLSSPDIVFVAARSVFEGAYVGHEGLRRYFADNAESFERFQIDVDELRDLGDRLFVSGKITICGRGGHVETTIPTAGVAEFADGKLTRWEDHRERDAALAAAGLTE